jgi:hypothetical protein
MEGRSMRSVAAVWLGTAVLVFSTATAAGAAGPWRARVVDATTGLPLEGVIVVASFVKYTSGPAGWAGGEYYGSDEVVTAADGTFEIPRRLLWNPIRLNLTKVGVDFVLLKPGYGHWEPRIPRGDDPSWDDEGMSAVLERDDVVLAMRPLSHREREEFIKTFNGPLPVVPDAKYPRLRAAVRHERRLLGLE